MCQPEDINNTITVNADNNLQRHEQDKLGHMHKPSTPTTPFIHGDDVIGELYQKNMVLIPFTIDPWARFSPMLQAFLTTTHHPRCQKLWQTSQTNNKYHRPNANLMLNVRPNHHAHLGSSRQLASDGANLPCPHAKHSLETPTSHPHQVYIHFNSSDSAFQRCIAHCYVMLPIRSNFIPQQLH